MAMGYPVVVRMGNLPVDIQNGKGIGDGELVGWLPIVCLSVSDVQWANACTQVPEDEAEKGVATVNCSAICIEFGMA